MQDAGDFDDGGLEKSKKPTEDKTVELRKSCDYCVRLKRACDGKNPCSLCSRRNKECTRSKRKKSGPAKGTKYAPRRKRSTFTDWAGHGGHPSSLAPREPGLHHGFAGSGVGVAAGGAMVGAGGAAAAGGGRGGEQLYHHPSVAPGELTAVTGGAPYLGGGHGVSSSSAHPTPSSMFGGRGASSSWMDDPLASARHQQGRRAAELGGRAGAAAGSLPSASSALPFPMPMAWYAPGAHDAATEAGVSLEEYRHLSHRLEPPMGYSNADPFPQRQQQQQQQQRWSISSMEAQAVGERTVAGIDPQRRRTWEPPPGSWPGHSDPLLSRSPQAGVGPTRSSNRMMPLSPPAVPDRPLMRPDSESYAPATEREAATAAAAAAGHLPERLGRMGMDAESSLSYLPPPREPPDPTAGFSFHPAANSSSWRRPSQGAPWESPGGGGGGGGGGRAVDRDDPGVQPRHAQQSAYFDPSDRPRVSWNSTGGGGGGAGGGGSADYTGGRRYHADFRGEGGVQEREMGGGGVATGWPPHPHSEFDRRHEERREDGRGDDGRRQQTFSQGGWPGGSGDDLMSTQQQQQQQQQQRSERGWQGSASGQQDWEGGRRGAQIMPPPLDRPREAEGGGGSGIGGGRRGRGLPFEWESDRGAAPSDPHATRPRVSEIRDPLPASRPGDLGEAVRESRANPPAPDSAPASSPAPAPSSADAGEDGGGGGGGGSGGGGQDAGQQVKEER